MSSPTPKTFEQRGGNGESSKGDTNEREKFPAPKKRRKPSATNSTGNNDDINPSASSVKKIKISHYFGGAATATSSSATADATKKVIPGKGRVSGNDVYGKGVGGNDGWSGLTSKGDARIESRDRGSLVHAGTVEGMISGRLVFVTERDNEKGEAMVSE